MGTKTHTRLFPLLALCFALAACESCATTNTTPTTVTVPGALNNIDAQVYQNMHTAQAAIEQAKVDIAKFPQFKDALNKVIASYNTAESAYQAYHATAKGDVVQLQNQVSTLLVDIGKLQVSMGMAVKP